MKKRTILTLIFATGLVISGSAVAEKSFTVGHNVTSTTKDQSPNPCISSGDYKGAICFDAPTGVTQSAFIIGCSSAAGAPSSITAMCDGKTHAGIMGSGLYYALSLPDGASKYITDFSFVDVADQCAMTLDKTQFLQYQNPGAAFTCTKSSDGSSKFIKTA